MQVHYDEGTANHIGPEPCAGTREDVGEASAGERAGQPLSRDRKDVPGADAVCVAEGNIPKCANASAWATRRGWRPCGPKAAPQKLMLLSKSVEIRHRKSPAGQLYPPITHLRFYTASTPSGRSVTVTECAIREAHRKPQGSDLPIAHC